MRILIVVGLMGFWGCGDDARGGDPTFPCDPPLTQGDVDAYCYGLGFGNGCTLSCDPTVVIVPMCEPQLSCGDAGAPTCICP